MWFDSVRNGRCSSCFFSSGWTPSPRASFSKSALASAVVVSSKSRSRWYASVDFTVTIPSFSGKQEMLLHGALQSVQIGNRDVR